MRPQGVTELGHSCDHHRPRSAEGWPIVGPVALRCPAWSPWSNCTGSRRRLGWTVPGAAGCSLHFQL